MSVEIGFPGTFPKSLFIRFVRQPINIRENVITTHAYVRRQVLTHVCARQHPYRTYVSTRVDGVTYIRGVKAPLLYTKKVECLQLISI